MTTDPFDRAVARTEAENDDRRRQRRQRARLRRGVGQKKAFQIHAVVFVAVQALLFAIWLASSIVDGFDHPWFLYPLLGWGIGLAAHYFAVRNCWRHKPKTGSDARVTYSGQ